MDPDDRIPESRMPAPSDHRFAEKIRDLEASLPDPKSAFRLSFSDTKKPPSYRFAALYGLLHRLRREEQFEEYARTVQLYEAEFGIEPYYHTFRAVVSRGHGTNPQSLRTALQHSERAVQSLEGVPGVLHQFAEIVATLCDFNTVISTDLLNLGIERSTRAMILAGGTRPHYHATRSRLYLRLGDTDAARADISAAIENEDSTGRDFPRRISRYEGIRLLITITERQQEVATVAENVRHEMTGLRKEQIELLAILAAVVAFLAAFAGVAARATLSDGLRLIIASGGVVAVVFSSLALAFGGARIGRLVPAGVMGLLLIGLALVGPEAVWDVG